ncbi:MAG TPA: alpha/beta hydrolase, partial [Trebonia sp.]|nr:alpha/beta hydrolase [Trebonia sp.]
AGIEPRHVVLYFHGGVYVLGDAFQAADLAAQVGRRTSARVFSVDYRLAPEHPFPAAVDDALAAYEGLLHNGTDPADIVFAGESAGGGLAIATLVNARDHGLPQPAAAFVMSPYADLTLAGETMETKGELDPLLSRESLAARIPDYTAGQDPALGLISPVFADLTGLPPLIIQAGTHEVLLDDALRLARQAATADVEVTLDITPGVPHVFQTFYPVIDEATAALDRAGQFLSARLNHALVRDKGLGLFRTTAGYPGRRKCLARVSLPSTLLRVSGASSLPHVRSATRPGGCRDRRAIRASPRRCPRRSRSH